MLKGSRVSCLGDNIVTAVRCSGLACEAVDGMRINQKSCLPVEKVIGHVLDERRALSLLPDGNDNKFSEVKVRRCANEFWDGSQRRGKVLHDASDGGMSESLELFVVRYGADCFRIVLSDEKVGSNFN